MNKLLKKYDIGDIMLFVMMVATFAFVAFLLLGLLDRVQAEEKNVVYEVVEVEPFDYKPGLYGVQKWNALSKGQVMNYVMWDSLENMATYTKYRVSFVGEDGQLHNVDRKDAPENGVVSVKVVIYEDGEVRYE